MRHAHCGMADIFIFSVVSSLPPPPSPSPPPPLAPTPPGLLRAPAPPLANYRCSTPFLGADVSSTASANPPSLCIDSDINTVCKTGLQLMPWVSVKLDGPKGVGIVNVWNYASAAETANCSSWCNDHTQSWVIKCAGFTECNTCPQCTGVPADEKAALSPYQLWVGSSWGDTSSPNASQCGGATVRVPDSDGPFVTYCDGAIGQYVTLLHVGSNCR